jgi:hypothetical protein
MISLALSDTNPIGKLNFLRYYGKARDEALTAQKVEGGFRGTGIWPRNKARVVTFRQVVAPRPALPEPVVEPFTSQIRTPTSCLDPLELQRAINNNPGTPLAFRKMTKALNTKDIKLVLAREKIRRLELQLEQLRATKRRKTVTKDPNERFVNIQQIIEARKEMKASLEPEEAPEEVVESEEEQPATLRRSGRIRVPTKRTLKLI